MRHAGATVNHTNVRPTATNAAVFNKSVVIEGEGQIAHHYQNDRLAAIVGSSKNKLSMLSLARSIDSVSIGLVSLNQYCSNSLTEAKL